jgi:hypothetical protein
LGRGAKHAQHTATGYAGHTIHISLVNLTQPAACNPRQFDRDANLADLNRQLNFD